MGAASVRTVTAGLDRIEQLLPLFEAYRAFYEAPTDTEGSRAFLRERLAKGEAVVFMALSEDRPAGFTLLYPSYSSVRRGRLFILNDLFVDRAHRQRGVGRLLLDAAVEFARAEGALGLQLETQRTNTVAQALYLEQGWEPDDEFCTYQYRL